MIRVPKEGGGFHVFPDGTPLSEIEAMLSQESVKSEAAKNLEGMSSFRKTLYGAERSLDESAMGLKQVFPQSLGGGLTPEDEKGLAVRREMEKQIPGSWAPRLAGDVVQYAAPTKLATLAATKGIPLAINAAKAFPKALGIAGAGAAGAGIGAAQPVIGEESRGENATTGGLFGAGGQALGNVAGRAIEGIVAKNPALKDLPQAIVDKLTLGQSANIATWPGRIASATEEKLQSIPVVGDWVRNKRQGNVTAWRDDLLNSVSPKGFTSSGENVRDRIASIYKEYRKRYQGALAGQQVNPSQLFESQVLKISNDPRSGIPAAERDTVRKTVMDYYNSMFHGTNPGAGAPPGTAAVLQGGARGTPIAADAGTAKDFEAFLTSQASQWRKSNAPNASNMAQMYDDLERAWSVSYKRQLPVAARRATKELDQGYAPYKTVERAGQYVANDAGEFTPQQLLSAVKARTSGPKFARGEGILQDGAQAARSALIDRVPNSGTTDRAALIGLGAGVWADPITTGTALAVGVPGMLTKTGRNVMTGDTKAQKLLRKLRINEGFREAGGVTGASLADIAYPEYSE